MLSSLLQKKQVDERHVWKRRGSEARRGLWDDVSHERGWGIEHVKEAGAEAKQLFFLPYFL